MSSLQRLPPTDLRFVNGHIDARRGRGRPHVQFLLEPPVISKKPLRPDLTEIDQTQPSTFAVIGNHVRNKRQAKDARFRQLETALLQKALDVLEGRRPTDQQRSFMEAECSKIGLVPAKSKWTRCFNKECSPGKSRNTTRRPPKSQGAEISAEDLRWLDRLGLLKEIGGPMTEEDEILILDCSTFKLNHWGPKRSTADPCAVFCYIVASRRLIVCRWTDEGVNKRCIVTAACVAALVSPTDDDYQVVKTDGPGKYIQQLRLRCFPVYEIWAPHIQDNGDVHWRWDQSSPVIDTGCVPRITFSGGETLAGELFNALNSRAAVGPHRDRCLSGCDTPPPCAHQEGLATACNGGPSTPAELWTPINAVQNTDHEDLSSNMSSGNQGDDEASISRRTTSQNSDYSFLLTPAWVPPVVSPFTTGYNMFDRMRANNELGQAILDRWTSDPAGPPVSQVDFYAAQDATRNVPFAFPQHVDDVFSSVHLDHQEMLPTATIDRSSSESPSDLFSGFEAQFWEQDALDAQQQAEQALPSFSLDLDLDAPADWDYLADMPELSFDRSVSLSTATSLPLITPSQSLDVLPRALSPHTGQEGDAELVPTALMRDIAPDTACGSGKAKDDRTDSWETFLRNLDPRSQGRSSLFPPGPPVTSVPPPQRAFDVALQTDNCLGITLQDGHQDVAPQYQDTTTIDAETQLADHRTRSG